MAKQPQKVAEKTAAPTLQEGASKGALVAHPAAGFDQELRMREPYLRSLLPSWLPMEKFRDGVMTAISVNKYLFEKCSRPSIMKAVMEAAECGLSLNPRLKEADIIPRWNSRTQQTEAQFEPRFGGYMKLARQSGEVTLIYAHCIREHDTYSVELGFNKKLTHTPLKDGDRGKLVHAYCVWTLANGQRDFEILDEKDIQRARGMSEAAKKDAGPWKTDEEEMWRKTAVRRASKYMPLAAEPQERMAKAVDLDDARTAGKDASIVNGTVIVADAVDITGDGNEPVKTANSMDRLERTIVEQKTPTPVTQPTPAATPAEKKPNTAGGTPAAHNTAPQPKPEPKVEHVEAELVQPTPKVPHVTPLADKTGATNWDDWKERATKWINEQTDPEMVLAFLHQHERELGGLGFSRPGEDEEFSTMCEERMSMMGQ